MTIDFIEKTPFRPTTPTCEPSAHGDGWLTPSEYAKLTPRERRKLLDERGRARRERYARATAQGVAQDYYDALAGMPTPGGRHVYIWNVVRVAAKRAERVLDLTCEQFVEDCQEAARRAVGDDCPDAWSRDRLTDAELRSIWNAQPSDPVEAVDVDAVAAGSVERRSAPEPEAEPPPPQPWEREPTDMERGGVARLVDVGETLATSASGAGAKLWPLLRSCSRAAIPSGYGEQAAGLVRTLAAIAGKLGVKGGGKWYAGDRYGAKVAANVRTAAGWCAAWTEGGEAIPPQLSMNPHTGEGVEREGGKSYRNGDTVAAHLFALVEFDALPLTKQAAFWLGVLATGALDVIAIVYSANKSLHGIVRVPRTGAGPLGSRANWDAAWGKANAKTGEVEKWGPLSRLLLSSRDPAKCVDFASGSNACGLFRLAGHLRTDKVTTPTVQALLWLTSSAPSVAVPEPHVEAAEERCMTESTDSRQERAQAASDPFAWGKPSPVVPIVVAIVESYASPPTVTELADLIRARAGIDFPTARQYIRRAVEAGAVIEARINGSYRYALHATDFREPKA